MTDNGPCFVSEEFEIFLAKNGVKHITTAPYHPATNGLAERAVQTVKRGLRKEKQGSMKTRLAKILMAYRSMPQSTTGMSPAQLLLGRRIRTRLDLLVPSTSKKVEHRQWQQKVCHDKLSPRKPFNKGEKVYARNFGTSTGQKWLPAVIVEVTGPVSFMVRLQDNRLVRRHMDHLQPRVEHETTTQVEGAQESEFGEELSDIRIRAPLSRLNSRDTPENSDITPGVDPDPTVTADENTESPEANDPVETPGREADIMPGSINGNAPSPAEQSEPRKTYPKRIRRPPNWYRDHT